MFVVSLMVCFVPMVVLRWAHSQLFVQLFAIGVQLSAGVFSEECFSVGV